MTIRGAVMRSISIGANLLLLALVSPTELGLFAVARGTFTLLQYIAELGIGKAMVRRAQEAFGRVDILVNNAGYGIRGSVVDTAAGDWDDMADDGMLFE